MWIITTTGIISAVIDRDDENIVHIRSRTQAALRDFVPTIPNRPPLPFPNIGGKWQHNACHHAPDESEADYPWRCVTTHRIFKELLACAANKMEYDNFKSAITDRVHASDCHQVWDIFKQSEDR